MKKRTEVIVNTSVRLPAELWKKIMELCHKNKMQGRGIRSYNDWMIAAARERIEGGDET